MRTAMIAFVSAIALGSCPPFIEAAVHIDFVVTSGEIVPTGSPLSFQHYVVSMDFAASDWDTVVVSTVTFSPDGTTTPPDTATYLYRVMIVNDSCSCEGSDETAPAQDFHYQYRRNSRYNLNFGSGYQYGDPGDPTHRIDIGATGCGIVDEGTLVFELLPQANVSGDPYQWPPVPVSVAVRARFTLELGCEAGVGGRGQVPFATPSSWGTVKALYK